MPKINVSDDVEDMRKQFEEWEKDDCKENKVKKEKRPLGNYKLRINVTCNGFNCPIKYFYNIAGRRIWHIEAYIEQTVFESSSEA